MTGCERLDLINLHIHLGKQEGLDVSKLISMRQERYLKSWNIYSNLN